MEWTDFDWLLDRALAEDAARRDVTSAALLEADRQAEAQIRAGARGTLCGLPLARRLAARFDEAVQFEARAQDGDTVEPGTLVARLSGPAVSILALERTMLNFLQRLSGVATLTATFVERVAGTEARIYDTRKTMPGWRALDKYAVRCGGGSNHRMSLDDAVLVKDNHLALVSHTAPGLDAVREAVVVARAANPELSVEVEVDTLEQLDAALDARPDVILLDNMTPEQFREAVARVRERSAGGPRPMLEASGAIALSNVADYAVAGADRIAVGALTHSAPALDLSMEIAD